MQCEEKLWRNLRSNFWILFKINIFRKFSEQFSLKYLFINCLDNYFKFSGFFRGNFIWLFSIENFNCEISGHSWEKNSDQNPKFCKYANLKGEWKFLTLHKNERLTKMFKTIGNFIWLFSIENFNCEISGHSWEKNSDQNPKFCKYANLKGEWKCLTLHKHERLTKMFKTIQMLDTKMSI
jgi:hypothetical protein